ncbi:hypothetical protein [Paenirhodobacter populi]|nr:hypothetical protein [Sinirhodobacter populi]
MGRILQVIAVLLVIGILAVIGYAYVGDMTPTKGEQRQNVTLPEAPSDN